MKLTKQEQERWEQYLKETQNIPGKPTIGKTDICRDKIKASQVLEAIAKRNTHYFKTKYLLQYLPGYTSYTVKIILPLLQEIGAIEKWKNTNHCVTYIKCFETDELPEIMDKLGEINQQ